MGKQNMPSNFLCGRKLPRMLGAGVTTGTTGNSCQMGSLDEGGTHKPQDKSVTQFRLKLLS